MNYPEGVTAGLGGFLVLFFLGLATYLLMRNMNARLRRMRWRAEQEDAEEAARREAAQHGGPPAAGPARRPREGADDRPGGLQGPRPADRPGGVDRSEGRRDRPVDRE